MLFGAILAAIADWYRMAGYAIGVYPAPSYPTKVDTAWDWTFVPNRRLNRADDFPGHVWADRMVSGLAYV